MVWCRVVQVVQVVQVQWCGVVQGSGAVAVGQGNGAGQVHCVVWCGVVCVARTLCDKVAAPAPTPTRLVAYLSIKVCEA